MPARLPVLQASNRIRKRVRRLVVSLQVQLAVTAPTAGEVHKLRRNTKKLRAWLKLVRIAGLLHDARATDALLRDNSARFSAERDATVRLHTLGQLQVLAVSKRSPPPLDNCRTLLKSNTAPARIEPDVLTRQQLHQALQQLLETGPTTEQLPTLGAALRKVYRKTRKHLRQARSSGNVEDLHRFRRWAKYLCYQLELVCELRQGRIATLHRRLEKLGALLGTWHDLMVLDASLEALQTQQLENQPLQLELPQVRRLCRQAQDKLLGKCLRLAAACFRETPGSIMCLPAA